MARDKYADEDLVNYYSKIYNQIDEENQKDPYGSYILSRVKGGQKTVSNKIQSEIRNFDMSFLDTIESVYPAILKIMRDPKKSLRYETEVVAVEKAKKVDSDTVRHLSSHTQLIKEITKAGDVIPSKVQTTFAEEELAIYENRFIKSLVRRIEMFLERRYEVMKVSLESFETERLNVTNEFLMSGQKVSVNIDIAIKNDLTVNVETTKEQYNRLLYIRELVQGLKGTDFMRALAKARDVVPPIMKTNILMHNPDFKLCYGLWLYLDRVDGIATNIDVKEKSLKYSAAFDKDITACMALALTAFIKNRGVEGIYSSRPLKEIKAPKPQMREEMELELNLEADNKKLEDYTMNEILLQQTASYFESSLEGLQEAGSKYNESIRVVYRQMLDMLDQIYPKAFGVADDELDSKDLYEQLEFARRRMMVLKTVRQSKQMNLARMGKDEKKVEKTIEKLEEKIRAQEAREREREEKQRAREEAARLAAIEKEAKEKARKKRIQDEAIKRQKEFDKKAHDEELALQEENIERQKKNSRIEPLAKKERDKLRELKALDDKKNYAADQKFEMPHRRKDEFDDMSDEELAALLGENGLVDKPKAEVEAPAPAEEKPEEPKKKVIKKAKKEEKKPAVDTSKSIEEMTDEELEALLAENNIPELQEETKPEPKKKATVRKVAAPSEDLDNMSDEELEALMAENGMDIDNSDFDLPSDRPQPVEKKPTIRKAKKPEEPVAEEAPASEEPTVDLDSISDNIDDISDEELAALMAENGIDDLGDEPKEEAKPQPKKKAVVRKVAAPVQQASEEKPEEQPQVAEESPNTAALAEEPIVEDTDDLSDIPQEELEALMAENDIPTEDESEPESAVEEQSAESAPEAQDEPVADDSNSADDDFDSFLNSLPEKSEDDNYEIPADEDGFVPYDPNNQPKEQEEEPEDVSDMDGDIEDMTDEELEALMAENDLFGKNED